MYSIARNFHWVQIFMVFADRPASVKIKMKKSTELEIDDVIMCIYVSTN